MCARSKGEGKIKRGVKNFSIQCCNLLRPPQDESWVSVSPLLSQSFGARWNETKSETTWNWHVPEHKMQSLLNFDSSHSTSSFLKFLSLNLSRFHMHTFVVSCCYDLRLLGCDSCEYKLCTQNGINYSCLEISISIHEKKTQNERTNQARQSAAVNKSKSKLFFISFYLIFTRESWELSPPARPMTAICKDDDTVSGTRRRRERQREANSRWKWKEI